MTTIDKTGASAAEFEARIAPFEADDARVETVARAMFFAQAEEGGYLDTAAAAWEVADVGQAKLRRLAAAAIAALPPSPAEEAVKRVEALADELASHRGGHDADVAAALRAALASPAPAPQEVERIEAHTPPGWRAYLGGYDGDLTAPAPQGEDEEVEPVHPILGRPLRHAEQSR